MKNFLKKLNIYYQFKQHVFESLIIEAYKNINQKSTFNKKEKK